MLTALLLGGLLGGCSREPRVEVKNLQVETEAHGRCVPIRFALSHPEALPAEVLVEVDIDGSGTFRPATPATAEEPGARTLATAATDEGSTHTFVWNSEADVPLSRAPDAVVRISASVQGRQHAVTAKLRVANVPVFLSRQHLPFSVGPTGVAAADFNQDGRTDLAVTLYQGANNLLLLHAAPDGSLKVVQSLTLSEVPYALTTGDFNGDHRPDVVAVAYAGTWFAFLSNAQGQLVQSGQGPVYDGSLTHVATADLDGDKVADLALLDEYEGRVFLLHGEGNGTFIQGPILPTGGKLDALALGDFNGDGQVDIAASSNVDAFVTLLLNHGEGVFAPARQHATGGVPDGLSVGDVDGDGKLDLATAPRGQSQLDVLHGKGDGTFTLAHRPLGGLSRAPVLVDLNRDGRLDVMASYPARNVQLLLGTPSGGFAAPVPVSAGALVLKMGELDANGDGTPDVFLADFGEKSVTVLLARPPDAC